MKLFKLFFFFLTGAHRGADPHSPVGHQFIHTSIKGNKKGMGVSFSVTYPHIQAFALPLLKDKQHQACPRRDNICIHHGAPIPLLNPQVPMHP